MKSFSFPVNLAPAFLGVTPRWPIFCETPRVFTSLPVNHLAKKRPPGFPGSLLLSVSHVGVWFLMRGYFISTGVPAPA